MPETMKEIQQVQETSTGVTPEQQKQVSDDIVKRVSQFKPETPETKPEEKLGFNVDDINSIQDPQAKAYAEKAYKSMLSDYTRKTQEIAELRKQYEQTKFESSNWTPEKIQALQNDPNFVKVANDLIASTQPTTNTGAEDSFLTDSEKQAISDMKKMKEQINSIANQNNVLKKQKEDVALQEKYANYNPEAIDTLTADLIKGKVQATREDLWKVINYEIAVKNAYQLGLQDKVPNLNEKVTSVSLEGLSATPRSDTPAPQKMESDRDAMKRIIIENIQKSRQGTLRKQ